MSIRLYWSPIELTAEDQVYRPTLKAKAGTKTMANVIPSKGRYTALGDLNPDAGKPRHTHALVLVRATDWTAIDADPTEVMLAEFPSASVFVAQLKSKTVGDLSASKRAKWSEVLAELGAPVGDIVGTTPLIRVFRRLFHHLDDQIWEEGLRV